MTAPTIAIEQLYYTPSVAGIGKRTTRAEEGVERAASARLRAAIDTTAFVPIRATYGNRLQQSLNTAQRLHREEEYVGLAFTRDEQHWGGILTRIRPVLERRPGTNFVHVLAGLPPSFTAREAIACWGADFWERDAEALPPNEYDLPALVPSLFAPQETQRWAHAGFRGPWDVDAVRRVISGYLSVGRVCIVAPPAEVARLIYTLTCIIPRGLLRDLTFCTFTEDPASAAHTIVGTPTLDPYRTPFTGAVVVCGRDGSIRPPPGELAERYATMACSSASEVRGVAEIRDLAERIGVEDAQTFLALFGKKADLDRGGRVPPERVGDYLTPPLVGAALLDYPAVVDVLLDLARAGGWGQVAAVVRPCLDVLAAHAQVPGDGPLDLLVDAVIHRMEDAATRSDVRGMIAMLDPIGLLLADGEWPLRNVAGKMGQVVGIVAAYARQTSELLPPTAVQWHQSLLLRCVQAAFPTYPRDVASLVRAAGVTFRVAALRTLILVAPDATGIQDVLDALAVDEAERRDLFANAAIAQRLAERAPDLLQAFTAPYLRGLTIAAFRNGREPEMLVGLRHSGVDLPLLRAWDIVVGAYRAANVAQVRPESLAQAIGQLSGEAREGLTDALLPSLARCATDHETLNRYLVALGPPLVRSPDILFIHLLLEVDLAFPYDAGRLIPFLALHLLGGTRTVPLREQMLHYLVDADRKAKREIAEAARRIPRLPEMWRQWEREHHDEDWYKRINTNVATTPPALKAIEWQRPSIAPATQRHWDVVREAYQKWSTAEIAMEHLATSIEALPEADRPGVTEAFLPKLSRMVKDEQSLRKILDILAPALVRSRDVLFLQLLLYSAQNRLVMGDAGALFPYFAIHLSEHTDSFPLRERWLRRSFEALSRDGRRYLDALMSKQRLDVLWKAWKEQRAH